MNVERPSDPPARPETHRGAIWVESVAGVESAQPQRKSEITPDDFRTALEAFLRDAGCLAPDSASARYTLVAKLTSVEQPAFAFNVTVTTKVRYDVLDTATHETASMEVTARGTAGAREAFLGSKRLKIANDRSMAANIRALLGEIQSLP